MGCMEKKHKQPTGMALTASHKAFIDSGTAAHMMKDMLVINGNPVTSDIIIGTAGEDALKATAQGESVIKLSGWEKPVKLNQVLRVPDADHSLISASRLCDYNHTVNFTKKKCVVKKKNFVIVVCKRV